MNRKTVVCVFCCFFLTALVSFYHFVHHELRSRPKIRNLLLRARPSDQGPLEASGLSGPGGFQRGFRRPHCERRRYLSHRANRAAPSTRRREKWRRTTRRQLARRSSRLTRVLTSSTPCSSRLCGLSEASLVLFLVFLFGLPFMFSPMVVHIGLYRA